MKTLRQNKHFNKPLVIIIASVVAVILLASIYVYAFNGNLLGWTNGRTSDTSTDIDSEASQEQKDEGNRQKEATVKNDTNEKPSENTDGSETPTDQPDGTKNVSVTFTAVNQTSNLLQVRSLIGSVQNQGQCTLTLEREGRIPVVKTASVQALPNASTCQGFDVPIYELTTGNWAITLEFKNGTTTGKATTTITIT